MSAQNKAIDRRILEEVYSQGDLDVADELIAADFIGHASTPGIAGQGREEYKQFVVGLRAAFPDLTITVEDQLAEGDKVLTRWLARGTHTGEFQGIPPTGRRGELAGMTVERFANGKVVECWSNTDDLGLLQQLGVMSAPGAPETSAAVS